MLLPAVIKHKVKLAEQLEIEGNLNRSFHKYYPLKHGYHNNGPPVRRKRKKAQGSTVQENTCVQG
jgi:hypothetical protein